MKINFIFLSIFIIVLIAFLDVGKFYKVISANTPSQVEMRQMLNKPDEQMVKDAIQQKENPNFQERTQSNTIQTQKKQLDNVDKRRNSIKNQIP
jgi:preprotein translocase subunit SecF